MKIVSCRPGADEPAFPAWLESQNFSESQKSELDVTLKQPISKKYEGHPIGWLEIFPIFSGVKIEHLIANRTKTLTQVTGQQEKPTASVGYEMNGSGQAIGIPESYGADFQPTYGVTFIFCKKMGCFNHYLLRIFWDSDIFSYSSSNFAPWDPKSQNSEKKQLEHLTTNIS